MAIRLGVVQRIHVHVATRLVHVAKRGSQIDEASVPRYVRRQHARQPFADLRTRGVHDLAHRSDRHLGRLLVDRHDPPELVLDALEDVHFRVDHLPAPAAGLELPVEHDACADLELLREVRRLVEPRQRQHCSAVTRLRLEDAPPAPARVRRADGNDLRRHGRFRARHELRHRRERAAILVTERQVIQHIFDAGDPEPRELLGALGADTLEKLRGGGEQSQRRSDVTFRREVRRSRRRTGLLQRVQLVKTCGGGALPRLVGVEREVVEESAQPLQRRSGPSLLLRGAVDQLQDAGRRQRVGRETLRPRRRQIAQRRLDDAHQLIEGGRLRAHQPRLWTASPWMANGSAIGSAAGNRSVTQPPLVSRGDNPAARAP